MNVSAKPLTSGGSHDVTSARICTVEVDGDVVALVLPQQNVRVDRVPANRRDAGTARRIDLETGRVSRVRWRRVDDALEIEGGIACAVPTLVWFGA